MTVYSDVSRVRYVGNGVTTQFAVPFKFFLNADGYSQVAVYVGNSDIPLVEKTNYTVNGAGREEGGEVVFAAAPEKDVQIAIIRNVPQTQEVILKNEDKFPALVYEQALDKLTMEVQEVKENLKRAIVLPPTSDEKPLEVRNELLAASTQAVASATAALKSENAAKTSEISVAGQAQLFEERVVAATAEFDANAAEKQQMVNVSAETAAQSATKAEQEKQFILDNPGFQAVATDLTGTNNIGYVAENIEEISKNVAAATTAATTASEAAANAQAAAGEAVKEIQEVKTQAISEFNTNAAEKQQAIDVSVTNATQSAAAAAASATAAENMISGFDAHTVSKKEEFDANVSAQTTAFNNNADLKTSDFDKNAAEKQVAVDASATAASTSESYSQIWAEGMDEEVLAIGGEHSAKGWADEAKKAAVLPNQSGQAGKFLSTDGISASWSAAYSIVDSVPDVSAAKDGIIYFIPEV